jgi:hypothetical protein
MVVLIEVEEHDWLQFFVAVVIGSETKIILALMDETHAALASPGALASYQEFPTLLLPTFESLCEGKAVPIPWNLAA